MSKHIASTITSTGILLFVGTERYVIGNDHPNFGKIKDAIGRKDYDAVADLADIRSAVRKWMSKGQEFSLTNDLIELHGVPFSDAVTDKVMAMIDAGNDADPLFNFLRKVRENPSKAAQDELLLFCVANGFMIHEDGDLIAYKSVRGDYTDIHSGKFNNSVGQVVTMPRFQVDDNRERTCSAGLHFASHQYASTWAGEIDGENRRLMVMKINPKDVVSIPNDYGNQKGRCARYEVIAELGGSPLPPREVYTDSDLGRGDVRTALDVDRELDDLQDEIDAAENEMQDLNDRIGLITDNGGDATNLEFEREQLELEIDGLYSRKHILQDELDELELES